MPGGAVRCNARASARGITESIAPWISSTGVRKCAMVAMGANSGKRMRQRDYWDVVEGNARVVLVDLRDDSATAGDIRSVILGEHSPQMVAISPHVAHGYQTLDLRDVSLNYYVTEPYDPDEGRIPYNDPGIGFDWSIENI